MVQAQPEELPIDIDYAKFLPWLIDRRRIPRDWHTHLNKARSLLRHAINTTPPAARSAFNLPSTDPLTSPLPYFHALDILHAFTASDIPSEWQAGPEKDLVGRYKQPTSRAWAAAVAAFEQKFVYLADCAQVLTRYADVDARAFKDVIAALQRDATELAKRDAPAVTAAAQARDRFDAACQQFHLAKEEGMDYSNALRQQIERRVPLLLRDAVRCVKQVRFGDAVRYYHMFAAYVCGGDVDADLCATVTRVMEGDVDQLVRPVRREDVRVKGGGSVNLDIHVDRDADPADAAHAQVDWGSGIDASGTADEAHGGVEEGAGNAQLLVGDGSIECTETVDTLDGKKGRGQVRGDAVGPEELTLADPAVREMFMNDLIELDAFLAQRAAELSLLGDTDIGVIMQQAKGAPDRVKAVDTEKIKQMQEAVEAAISAINSADTRRMLALQSDPNRLERVAKTIVDKKRAVERTHTAIDVLRKRRLKAQEDLAVELPKLEKLGVVTRDIKRRTEDALSALYKGRTVNILGEINNVFPPVD